MSSSATPSTGFARLAESYDRLRPVDERWLEIVDRMVELGDLRGRRVLDVGCGTGRLAIVLAERHGAKVWGIDPSAEMLELARFPDAATTEAELRAGGFAEVVVERFEIERSFSRELGLGRLRGRYGSTFDLLDDDEYRRGLEQAERELPDRVEY